MLLMCNTTGLLATDEYASTHLDGMARTLRTNVLGVVAAHNTCVESDVNRALVVVLN